MSDSRKGRMSTGKTNCLGSEIVNGGRETHGKGKVG